MFGHLTTMAAVHVGLALAGIVIGLVQFFMVKGTRAHRALGYAYVYGMLLADGAALSLYRFTGTFNAFHAGAIVNLVCIVMAMMPVLRSPRPTDWKIQHYRWICGSYVGLVAAGITGQAVRMMAFSTRNEVWIASAVAAVAVTTIGVVLIGRYRPVAGPNPAPRQLPDKAFTADFS